MEPPEIIQFPTDPPEVGTGNNVCNICWNGKFPGDTAMVIAMLDIGVGAAPCDYFYKIGQDGLIPKHLCDPLQHFAYVPCGCGYGIDVGAGPDLTSTPSTPTMVPSDMPSQVPSDMPSMVPTSNQWARKLESGRRQHGRLKGSTSP
ncbi:expressed unknown protein [Seminavis robusta]|uniref:Uncharacterized protein n=1 Tax=Seminavis robusta TaxID=568900 RepID=A0A9N8DKB4_9STRA|nr:expressed unknown protein [Seminavis robusta]|eukprot:Sro175_g077050.1 n/a (146) ;mRNA; r:50771-51208